MVYPIIYRVSTIRLVVQDFATIHSRKVIGIWLKQLAMILIQFAEHMYQTITILIGHIMINLGVLLSSDKPIDVEHQLFAEEMAYKGISTMPFVRLL